MPDLEASVWQKYGDDGVLVYGIHPSHEDPGQLADFAAQTGVTFPLVADQGTKSLFAYPPGVGYPYPRDVVVGKDLTIHAIENSYDVDAMDTLIQQLLDP